MHFFICKRFAQKSPSRTPRRTGQACPLSRASLLQAGFARRKKESAAADGVCARSRQAAKPVRRGGKSNRVDYKFFAPAYRRQVFARRKKNSSQSRQAAKSPPRRRARTSVARCEKPTCGRQARAKKREISERPFYSFASLRLCEKKNVPRVGFIRSGSTF